MRVASDLRHLLRGRPFRQLFWVRMTSQGADGIFQTGLASYILFNPQDAPDAASIAGAFAALLLPFTILGPFAGVLLDRWRRQRILVTANLLRVLPVLAAAACVGVDAPHEVLFGCVLAAMSVNRFLLAGLSASLPHVVRSGGLGPSGRDELVLANAIVPTAGALAVMAGAGVGAGWRELGLPGGDVSIVCLSATAYVTSAVLATRIPTDLLGPDGVRAPITWRDAWGRVVHDVRSGLAHLAERPAAAWSLAAIGAQRFGYGLTTIAMVLYFRNGLHGSDADAAFASISSALVLTGAAFFAAAAVTPVVVDRVGTRTWMLAALAVSGLVQLWPALDHRAVWVLVAASVVAFASQAVKICVDTVVQLAVADSHRGRVFSLYDVLNNAVLVGSSALAVVVVPDDGVAPGLLGVVGVAYVLLGTVPARVRVRQTSGNAADRSGS